MNDKNYSSIEDYATLEEDDVSQYSISWSNLSYSTGSHHLLKDINGHVGPGEILAIMGPSGSGKTTLLDLLADRVSSGRISGEILVNGKLRNADYRLISGYVGQDDVVMEVFTVEEQINFAANLSLSYLTPNERKEKVHDLVQHMGLESCLKTRVGGQFFRGISSGQRRRLSISLSLICNPCIILMDEPTSGLDSSSTYNFMAYLQTLAQSGRTIILTIHQPSSQVCEFFTSLLLLSEGRTVYYGSAKEKNQYFSSLGHSCPPNWNPAEYFVTLVNTDFDGHGDLDKLCKAFESSSEMKALQERIEKSKSDDNPGYVYIFFNIQKKLKIDVRNNDQWKFWK